MHSFEVTNPVNMKIFNDFLLASAPVNFQKNSKKNLTKLTDLTEKVLRMSGSCISGFSQVGDNPTTDEMDRINNLKQSLIIQEKQWQLDAISEIKKNLADAIANKRNYYDNHWFGKITKFTLKIFGKWNEGTTSSIAKAEKLLSEWNTENPNLTKLTGPFNPLIWGKNKLDSGKSYLDFTNFYNYKPEKA